MPSSNQVLSFTLYQNHKADLILNQQNSPKAYKCLNCPGSKNICSIFFYSLKARLYSILSLLVAERHRLTKEVIWELAAQLPECLAGRLGLAGAPTSLRPPCSGCGGSQALPPACAPRLPSPLCPHRPGPHPRSCPDWIRLIRLLLPSVLNAFHIPLLREGRYYRGRLMTASAPLPALL